MYHILMNPLRKLTVSCLECLLVLLCLVGCNSRLRSVVSPPPVSSPFPVPEETKSLMLVTAQPTSPTLQVTQTSALGFDYTSTPVPIVTPQVIAETPVKSGSVMNDILLLVSEDHGSSSSRDSIWIHSLNETMPHVLIKDSYLSFDLPRWSHNGEWIAFRQSNWLDKSSFQLGVIHKDGKRKQVFKEKFGAIGWLNWSANDKLLIFDTPYSPFMVNIDTGEILDLWPDSDNNGAETRLKPSPKEDLIAFAEFKQVPGTEVKLWLLTLENQKRENIQLPAEITSTCRQGITTLEWSPDGASMITQFRGWPWEECEPQLWLYKLAERKWINVARLPPSISSYDYNEIGQVTWSKDGRWLAWETTRIVLIIAVEDEWRIVRKINIGIDDFSMDFPWVEDSNGNSIYSLNHNDYTLYPRQIVSIIGLSPDGTAENDRELLRIEEDPNWMPDNSFITPIIWEP